MTVLFVTQLVVMCITCIALGYMCGRSATKDASFELVVLLQVKRLQPRAYGVPLHRTLESILGHTVSIGALYTALEHLEAQGLVTSWEGEPTAERGWRPKRFYALTEKGAARV